jgi:AcrR family transcriptional regulator
VSSRRYEQRRRAEAAARTRRRIIDAVIERLRETPAEPVAVEQIAQLAAVNRSTVYAIFGSRAGLFDAVGAEVFERGGYRQLVEATRHPDAREQLRGGLLAATRMFAGQRDIIRTLHSMAQLDERAVGGAVHRWEAERGAAMARIARQLDEQGHLRSEISVTEAEQTLWVLTSFEAFDLLFTGKGLTTDAVSDLLVASAERALCTVERRPARRRSTTTSSS